MNARSATAVSLLWHHGKLPDIKTICRTNPTSRYITRSLYANWWLHAFLFVLQQWFFYYCSNDKKNMLNMFSKYRYMKDLVWIASIISIPLKYFSYLLNFNEHFGVRLRIVCELSFIACKAYCSYCNYSPLFTFHTYVFSRKY